MHEIFDITPTPPNLYVTQLKDTFTAKQPVLFTPISEHDAEVTATLRNNIKACAYLAVIVGFLFAGVIDVRGANLFTGLHALIAACLLGVAFWLGSRSGNARKLRLAVTQKWVTETIEAALPPLAKPATLTEQYRRHYKLYQQEVNRLTTVLHTKTEELARTHPLSQFPKEMERFITYNEDVKTYITACFTHAETLGVSAPLHA